VCATFVKPALNLEISVFFI